MNIFNLKSAPGPRRVGGCEWTLKREREGWIYRHQSGAGHSGHHRNPWRCFQVANKTGNSVPYFKTA